MIVIWCKGYKTYYKNEDEFCEYVSEKLYHKIRREGLIGFVENKESNILDIKQWKAQNKIESIYKKKEIKH
jgi:hypothetical protein